MINTLAFEATLAQLARLSILYRVDIMLKQDCRAISTGLSMLYRQGEALRRVGSREDLETFQAHYRSKLDALDEVMQLLQRVNYLRRRISVEELARSSHARLYWGYHRRRLR